MTSTKTFTTLVAGAIGALLLLVAPVASAQVMQNSTTTGGNGTTTTTTPGVPDTGVGEQGAALALLTLSALLALGGGAYLARRMALNN